MCCARPGWSSAIASYELHHYSEAETAYGKVLALLPAGDKARSALVDNLAASIYKQGEEARAKGDFRAAANHFLRVGQKAPTSKIRPTAEYDAAAALIELKDWEKAATVLTGFRKTFPGNTLQPEVTKKIAYVYKEAGKLSLAAGEYERIERESKDDEVRREALTVAAQLHEKAGETARALEVYRRYVDYFPQPVELNLEMRNKIAEILKAQDDRKNYLDELAEDRRHRRRPQGAPAPTGPATWPRRPGWCWPSRNMMPSWQVRLVKPLKVNLARKRDLMKASTEAFSKLLDYEVGEVTAAATYLSGRDLRPLQRCPEQIRASRRAEPRGTGAVQPGHRGAGVSLRGEGHRHPREKPPAHLPGYLQRVDRQESSEAGQTGAGPL